MTSVLRYQATPITPKNIPKEQQGSQDLNLLTKSEVHGRTCGNSQELWGTSCHEP